MKKIAMIAMTTLLLFCFCFAFADEESISTDYTALSFRELLALRQKIDNEMVQRTIVTDHSDYSLDGLLYVSNGSEVHIKFYEGTNPNVVIPATIDGLPVTEIHSNAFKNNQTIETVVVSEGITELPDEFLSGCSNLTNVTLPEGIREIPSDCFAGCTKLANLTIPKSVTKIGDWAIINTKITNLVLHEGIVELERGSFQSADFLEGVIVLPSTLNKIGDYSFSICSRITGFVIQSDVTIGESCLSGSSVSFVYVKDGCNVVFKGTPFGSSLRTAIIPASVTSIDNEVFAPCNLVTIVCPAGSYAETYAKSHFLMCDTENYEQYVQEYNTQYLNQ